MEQHQYYEILGLLFVIIGIVNGGYFGLLVIFGGLVLQVVSLVVDLLTPRT